MKELPMRANMIKEFLNYQDYIVNNHPLFPLPLLWIYIPMKQRSQFIDLDEEIMNILNKNNNTEIQPEIAIKILQTNTGNKLIAKVATTNLQYTKQTKIIVANLKKRGSNTLFIEYNVLKKIEFK